MATMDTHQTAETHMADAASARFAYRRFGSPAATPLLMLEHLRGNLDNRDPALTDALPWRLEAHGARDRRCGRDGDAHRASAGP